MIKLIKIAHYAPLHPKWTPFHSIVSTANRKTVLFGATVSKLNLLSTFQLSSGRHRFNMTPIYHFCTHGSASTLEGIKESCSQLLKLESLVLDKVCLLFGEHYIPRQKLSTSALFDKYSQKSIVAISSLQQSLSIANLSPEQVFNSLRLVFDFLSSGKVGFLRGDLHTLLFFQLQKDLQEKLQQHKSQLQYDQDDFKKLLVKVTNPAEFRLPFKGIFKRQLESKVNLYQRQLLLQQVTSDQSHMHFEEILDSLMRLNKVQEVSVVRRFMAEWILPLTSAIKEEQAKCLAKSLAGKRKIYGKHLLKINPEKIATTALSELIICIFQQICKQGTIDQFQLQLFDGIEEKKYLARVIRTLEGQIAFQRQQVKFKQCQKQLDSLLKQNKSKQVKEVSQNMDMSSVQAQSTKNKDPKHWKSQAFKQIEKNFAYKWVPPLLRKQFIQKLQARMGRFKQPKGEMPEQVQHELGQVLVFILKQVLTIQNKYRYKVPFLTSEHKAIKKQDEFISISILRINQYFLNEIVPKLQKTEDIFIHMERSLPTIIEPLPWVDPQIGGYYSQATTVMKYSHCPVQERVLKYNDNSRAFQVLNILSRTPWKINHKVLQVVEQIWSQGGEQSCIPKRYSEMINFYINSLKTESDPKKRKVLNKKIQNIRDELSLRGDFNLKLSIARAFSKIDYFYFPHNFDFRGRVYPIPPHFNHIGNDLVRGLLLFGKSKKVGKEGLRWLKIHTANLMGKDKAPIDQKLVFIEENMSKIHQIAKQPLKYREWLGYEDCWEAIASIFDLSAAMRSPSPQEYQSFLHIHQDGSCNGLQHYAAMGRDTEGAYQVNLGPAAKPSDIYTHVSKMVIKMIQNDLKGPPADHHPIARKLLGNVKRKTVKQTVMTSVYGVTFIGARQQIYKQLRDQNFMSQDQNYAASIYLAKLTLLAISNLFTGAHGIKEWFRKCASKVSRTGNPVGWITPLGLPVVEPYRKISKMDTIKTISHNMHLSKEVENIPVNKIKQATAFPPNYVHSLDSSHMMYTAEKCYQKGISFAAVHDSYWTHAASVNEMNILLRQQFICLHSQPLLQTFHASLYDRFPEIQFPPIPSRGDFDLQKVKESIYFFS